MCVFNFGGICPYVAPLKGLIGIISVNNHLTMPAAGFEQLAENQTVLQLQSLRR